MVLVNIGARSGNYFRFSPRRVDLFSFGLYRCNQLYQPISFSMTLTNDPLPLLADKSFWPKYIRKRHMLLCLASPCAAKEMGRYTRSLRTRAEMHIYSRTNQLSWANLGTKDHGR